MSLLQTVEVVRHVPDHRWSGSFVEQPQASVHLRVARDPEVLSEVRFEPSELVIGCDDGTEAVARYLQPLTGHLSARGRFKARYEVITDDGLHLVLRVEGQMKRGRASGWFEYLEDPYDDPMTGPTGPKCMTDGPQKWTAERVR